MKKIWYSVDADGYCLTPCPYNCKSFGGITNYLVGSYAEKLTCPHWHGEYLNAVICDYEQSKKKAVQ